MCGRGNRRCRPLPMPRWRSTGSTLGGTGHPPHAQVLRFAIDAVKAEAFNPRTLFLFGSYTIGGWGLRGGSSPAAGPCAGLLAPPHLPTCHVAGTCCSLPPFLTPLLSAHATLSLPYSPHNNTGKERLFLEAARVLQRKVYVSVAKRKVGWVGALPHSSPERPRLVRGREPGTCAHSLPAAAALPCGGAGTSVHAVAPRRPAAHDSCVLVASPVTQTRPPAQPPTRGLCPHQILDCLALPPEYASLLTTDDTETNLHAGARWRPVLPSCAVRACAGMAARARQRTAGRPLHSLAPLWSPPSRCHPVLPVPLWMVSQKHMAKLLKHYRARFSTGGAGRGGHTGRAAAHAGAAYGGAACPAPAPHSHTSALLRPRQSWGSNPRAGRTSATRARRRHGGGGARRGLSSPTRHWGRGGGGAWEAGPAVACMAWGRWRRCTSLRRRCRRPCRCPTASTAASASCASLWSGSGPPGAALRSGYGGGMPAARAAAIGSRQRAPAAPHPPAPQHHPLCQLGRRRAQGAAARGAAAGAGPRLSGRERLRDQPLVALGGGSGGGRIPFLLNTPARF